MMSNEKLQEKNLVDSQSTSMATRRESPSTGMMGGDVDLQVATAKQFPRSIGQAKQRAIELATPDQETAASCIYAIPKAGKVIEGPSARLAEIIAVSWGNLRVAAKTIGEDNGFTYAEAVGWDLENNTAISYQVKRRITNRGGERFSEDMVQVTANAAISIALRNVVFRIVPRAYVNEVYLAARKAAAGSIKTLKQSRAEMLQYFRDQGVAEQKILDLLNVAKTDDVTLDHLATLKGIAANIKSGLVSVETIFKRGKKPDEATPAEETSLATEKKNLLVQIRDELIKRWPGDSAESKDEKKNEIRLVFGKETWNELSTLPSDVLSAGLKVIKERAAGIDFFEQSESPAGGDDIPF